MGTLFDMTNLLLLACIMMCTGVRLAAALRANTDESLAWNDPPYLYLRYCWNDDCSDNMDKDTPNFTEGNFCDTLYGYQGSDWPIYMDKVYFGSDGTPNLVIEFFENDYCTGEIYSSYKSDGSGGGDDGNWYGVDQKIKSVRVYNQDDVTTSVNGAATKLVFFPWTGMMPYNEFPCRPWDGCSEQDFEANYCTEGNNYCDVVSSRTEGSCVSSDDLIWPITDLALVEITPDFAGQTCGDGFDYMCDFTGNYPLGSIYYNLWYSTHDQYYYPDMKDYCAQGNINDLCVYTRMWKSDGQPPQDPDWFNTYPFAEVVTDMVDLCSSGAGYMYSVCDNPDDPLTSGSPIYWRQSETESWVYGDQDNNYGGSMVPCADEADLWPMWTSNIGQKIDKCPSAKIGLHSLAANDTE